jgi:hypothetical protein
MLQPGRFADFITVDGSPLDNIAILQDKSRIRHVHIAGKRMQIPEPGYDPRKLTDRAFTNCRELYTQDKVRALPKSRQGLAAEQRNTGGRYMRPPDPSPRPTSRLQHTRTPTAVRAPAR